MSGYLSQQGEVLFEKRLQAARTKTAKNQDSWEILNQSFTGDDTILAGLIDQPTAVF